ncbi:MAG: hypothetical protein Q7T11_03755 [Deltaproteobacteria bacterium]|nr:hypothetical protein [Deltaproteobacteria bacterium]
MPAYFPDIANQRLAQAFDEFARERGMDPVLARQAAQGLQEGNETFRDLAEILRRRVLKVEPDDAARALARRAAPFAVHLVDDEEAAARIVMGGLMLASMAGCERPTMEGYLSFSKIALGIGLGAIGFLVVLSRLGSWALQTLEEVRSTRTINKGLSPPETVPLKKVERLKIESEIEKILDQLHMLVRIIRVELDDPKINKAARNFERRIQVTPKESLHSHKERLEQLARVLSVHHALLRSPDPSFFKTEAQRRIRDLLSQGSVPAYSLVVGKKGIPYEIYPGDRTASWDNLIYLVWPGQEKYLPARAHQGEPGTSYRLVSPTQVHVHPAWDLSREEIAQLAQQTQFLMGEFLGITPSRLKIEICAPRLEPSQSENRILRPVFGRPRRKSNQYRLSLTHETLMIGESTLQKGSAHHPTEAPVVARPGSPFPWMAAKRFGPPYLRGRRPGPSVRVR